MHSLDGMKMGVFFILSALAMVLIKESAAFTQKTTTLATFNVAINPFFEGLSGNSEFVERVELLIEEVTTILIIFSFL